MIMYSSVLLEFPVQPLLPLLYLAETTSQFVVAWKQICINGQTERQIEGHIDRPTHKILGVITGILNKGWCDVS